MNQLMNYQNSLCDMLPPYGPITTVDLILRVAMLVGVAAAIITAGILVKRGKKEFCNSKTNRKASRH